MTPEPSLVADLHAYDPKLRIRWGRHTEKWIIEQHNPCSDPRLANATPPPDDAAPIRLDLYEGWREGYVHVLTVDRELAHWRFIAPELAKADAWRAGGMKEINRRLDDEQEQWDKATDKNIDNWAGAASRDAYDHMGWFEKRTVSMNQPETPYVDTGLGFQVRDRRGE